MTYWLIPIFPQHMSCACKCIVGLMELYWSRKPRWHAGDSGMGWSQDSQGQIPSAPLSKSRVECCSLCADSQDIQHVNDVQITSYAKVDTQKGRCCFIGCFNDLEQIVAMNFSFWSRSSCGRLKAVDCVNQQYASKNKGNYIIQSVHSLWASASATETTATTKRKTKTNHISTKL